MGIIFGNVYPGSISDTDITNKKSFPGVLNYINDGHEIKTDKGFSTLYTIKGVTLN